jgi:hypothetical protein
MDFLIKWPTRGRPKKFIECLNRWLAYLSGHNKILFLVSQHTDDPCRLEIYHRFEVEGPREPMPVALACCSQIQFIESAAKTKVENINYGIGDRRFDVLIDAADDMWPEVTDYDQIIADAMRRHFPRLDGALHFWDGYSTLCTLSVMGYRLYRYFGYIYHPAYISLFCDNEFEEVCKRLGRFITVQGWGPGERCLIRHRHPLSIGEPYDALMRHTESFYAVDGRTYGERKARNFDIRPWTEADDAN